VVVVVVVVVVWFQILLSSAVYRETEKKYDWLFDIKTASSIL
jgi:hypothetical protein